MWSLLKIDNATTARQFDDITLYCQAVVLADGEFYRDDLKAAQNPAKHGVSFDLAKLFSKIRLLLNNLIIVKTMAKPVSQLLALLIATTCASPT